MTGPSPEPRIPDEAVEAAARAMSDEYVDLYGQTSWRALARAALAAAWPLLRAGPDLIEQIATVLASDDQAVLKVAAAQTLIAEAGR